MPDEPTPAKVYASPTDAAADRVANLIEAIPGAVEPGSEQRRRDLVRLSVCGVVDLAALERAIVAADPSARTAREALRTLAKFPDGLGVKRGGKQGKGAPFDWGRHRCQMILTGASKDQVARQWSDGEAQASDLPASAPDADALDAIFGHSGGAGGGK